jgi:hypothetical protein
MPTGRKIVQEVLQKAGVIVKNESPSSDEINDGISTINDMLESWFNESLLVYTQAKETFPLVGGVNEYTIGVGADFDTARPTNITYAETRLSGQTFDTPLSILSDTNYQTFSQDLLSQGLPEYLNYDGGNPIGKISIWPTPSTSYSLTIISEKPLLNLDLDTTYTLPPGWKRAIVYNGAIEVAPEYGQEPPAATVRIAAQSLGSIKLVNAKRQNMDSAPLTGGTGYNVLRGW